MENLDFYIELEKETFQYKVDTEEQVTAIIQEAKKTSKGIVTYKTAYRTKKEQGEVVYSWYVVTITHNYKDVE